MAGHFGSQVTLIHVFEIPAAWSGTVHVPLRNVRCFDSFSERVERNLQDYSIHLPPEQVQRVMADGDAASEITNWVQEHNVDLIMMPTHGYGRIREFLLGSVTAKVIHDANCPVWTDSLLQLRVKSHPKIATVLCAVELGEETIPLLRLAAQLAEEFSAKVHVIHAVRKAEARPRKWFDFNSRSLADRARMEISKRQSVAGTDFPVIIREARQQRQCPRPPLRSMRT
jgi:nucleotide-binding universal stress UspA family protein